MLVFNTVEHGNGVSDGLFLHVLIDNQLTGADKGASLSLASGAGESNGLSFANVFRRAFRIKFGVTDWNKLTNLSFTTSEGPQTWDGTSVEVHVLKNMPANDSGFIGWKDPYGTTFQSRIFTKNGKLYVWHVLAVSFDTLTNKQKLELYLYGPAAITDSKKGEVVGGLSTELITLSTIATNPSVPPFFDFGLPQ